MEGDKKKGLKGKKKASVAGTLQLKGIREMQHEAIEQSF